MLEVYEERLAEYSDEDLLDYIHRTFIPLKPRPCSVGLLSPNLVAKGIALESILSDSLAEHNLARALGIRVPDIKRVVTKDRTSYIIMDCV